MYVVPCSSFSSIHSNNLAELLTLTTACNELINDLFLSHSDFEIFQPVFDSMQIQINDLITNMM